MSKIELDVMLTVKCVVDDNVRGEDMAEFLKFILVNKSEVCDVYIDDWKKKRRIEQ